MIGFCLILFLSRFISIIGQKKDTLNLILNFTFSIRRQSATIFNNMPLKLHNTDVNSSIGQSSGTGSSK